MNDLNRFDLYDDPLVNPKVKSKAKVQLFPFVSHRHWMLSYEWQTKEAQLLGQTVFVDTFQKPRPKLAMDLYRRTNDRPG